MEESARMDDCLSTTQNHYLSGLRGDPDTATATPILNPAEPLPQRLQLKFLDHLSDSPYCLDDIYKVVEFILHGTTTSLSIMALLHNSLIDLTLHNIAEQYAPSCDIISHCYTVCANVSHCVTPPDIMEYHVTSLGITDHHATLHSFHTGSAVDHTSEWRPHCATFVVTWIIS